MRERTHNYTRNKVEDSEGEDVNEGVRTAGSIEKLPIKEMILYMEQHGTKETILCQEQGRRFRRQYQ